MWSFLCFPIPYSSPYHSISVMLRCKQFPFLVLLTHLNIFNVIYLFDTAYLKVGQKSPLHKTLVVKCKYINISYLKENQLDVGIDFIPVLMINLSLGIISKIIFNVFFQKSEKCLCNEIFFNIEALYISDLCIHLLIYQFYF